MREPSHLLRRRWRKFGVCRLSVDCQRQDRTGEVTFIGTFPHGRKPVVGLNANASADGWNSSDDEGDDVSPTLIESPLGRSPLFLRLQTRRWSTTEELTQILCGRASQVDTGRLTKPAEDFRPRGRHVERIPAQYCELPPNWQALPD
mmetsp:Transcript_34805/g.67110  ORF Transcript_34805/g.67110 Transcript_34805/m.67110 type:complete len:147 (-) Transcript_34805:252-692(-)